MQLHHPEGVQLENIEPGHQHIDLIYFARSAGPTDIEENVGEDKVGWYGLEDWDGTLPNLEVRSWCDKALSTVDNLD